MDPASAEARLDRLERLVDSLAGEVAQLKSPQPRSPGPLWSDSDPLPRSPAPRRQAPERRARATWSSDDIEKLAGRYGMLALATVTGLAAVGTFIGWAATRVQVGPELRVLVGFVLAIVLAGVGIRIRPRERSFGAVLMGLALAVTHVCAWGAGPAVLDIVPGAISLGLALVASATLAAFAHREEDEPLWCTGFGGAAIAPFVTTDGNGPALLLMLYGGAVMLAGCWAIRGRSWPIAGRVLALSAALYAGALMATPDSSGAPLMALALVMVVAGAGVIPFTAPDLRRGRLRAFGILAALAAMDVRDASALPGGALTAIVAIALAVLAWLAYADITADLPAGSILDGLVGEGSSVWDWVDAAFVPLAFMVALVAAVPGSSLDDAAPAAALAVAMLTFAARRPHGALRDAAVFTACAGTVFAVAMVGDRVGGREIMPAILAIPAVAFVASNRRLPASPWVPVGSILLLTCSVGAFTTLAERAAYSYVPFVGVPSVVAMAIVAAWVVAGMAHAGEKRAFQIAAWTVAFLCVHQELREAVSPTASTLLVISYYAATAVALVGAGRRLGNATLRHLGLVMALVAAAAAARGATQLDAVWARIAGYMVTSVFLLGLAWWYRQRGEDGEAS